jgi:PTH2 family peptidyl-tRNA hydrolase
MEAVKQVIVINKGLKMRRGKECAQAAHASMAWLTRRMEFMEMDEIMFVGMLTPPELEWVQGSFRKVTVQVDTAEELRELYGKARASFIEAHLITDAGLTEFHGEPTVTALGLGPDYDEALDKITGELRLY